MGEHRDEGLMDKVKNALGMGDDNRDDTESVEDREPGWAGVGEMMDERDEVTGSRADGGTAMGPSGGTGMNPDADSTLGGDTAAPAPYDIGYTDTDEETVIGADGTPTRGEAASGQSPFDQDDDDLETTRQERGI